jgi:gluconolactonase
MKSTILFAAVLGLTSTAIALAQTPAPRQGPGVQAAQDAREPAVLALCRNHHPAPRNPGNFRRPTDTGAARYHITAIPGVIAAGRRWKVVWRDKGNNADGIIGTDDGGLLVAQNDNSDVVKLSAAGRASIVYQDTDTGGALARNKQGALFIAERGLRASIWELAPQHKVIANMIDGDSFDCLGGVLNDLTAAANGGIYFSQGGLYYVAPDGKVTQQGSKDLRTNGIILSPDEKTLYVTNAGTLVAFDVQPDGSLTNQHVLATLPGGGGDGSTVDADGRIYVSAAKGIVVVSPTGTVLGTIPTPYGVISVAFSGADKKTLYAVVLKRSRNAGVRGIAGGEVVSVPMIAQGYTGRAK